MTILAQMKSLFGDSPILLLERGGVAAYFWSEREPANVGIVCTAGMSSRVQEVPAGASCPSREPRTELLAYCSPRDAEVLAGLLLDLAEYPFMHHRHLFWWQTLPLGKALMSGSSIAGVLLSMPPMGSDQVTFKVDEHRVDLVWVVPILGKELEYARDHGVGALAELIERQGIDVTDIRRATPASGWAGKGDIQVFQ